MRIVLTFTIVLLLFNCNQSSPQTEPIGIVLGKVDRRLAEASGLVASINNPGFFWTLNDSGNPAEVFLIDRQANIRLTGKLVNVKNRDWEDIAIDKGPDGKNYLYVADIGDNYASFEFKIIYRFEEPHLDEDREILISKYETLILKMPDGKTDAETILIDPKTHQLFMISKRVYGGVLYKAPLLLSLDTMMFEKLVTLPFNSIVSGSISADGRKILLKNYTNIYYWERSMNESLSDLLLRAPSHLPYNREPQGEAIAWSLEGCEFLTLSESRWNEPAGLIVHSMISLK